MSEPAVVINNLSKCYRLGVIGRKTLQDELRYWWHRIRGRNPQHYMGVIDKSQKDNLEGTNQHPQDFWALRNISLSVEKGEVVGIIGKNGAGKSTLLKLLSRITEPTTGEAVINGRVGSLLEVGTGFHPELTGRENIFMNGTILGMKQKEIQNKYDEIVEFAEIQRFIDTPVKRYSSGMYVRLAFAVAAHLEPEILVIDEVLAVGDLAFQKKCLKKMEDVGHAGRTVLFVSHNMSAITRLCSRSFLLENGELIESGASDGVVASYLSRSATQQNTQQLVFKNTHDTGDISLLNICVTRPSGAEVVLANVTEELQVNLRYQVKTPGVGFRCMISFCTSGVVAFASVEPQERRYLESGLYEAILKIPSNLLAECEYSLNISIFSSRGTKKHYFKGKDVFSFQVTDAIAGNSSRGDYVGGYRGVLMPLLDWENKKIS